MPGRCGTYAGNRDALNTYFDAWIAAQKQPPWKRTAILPMQTGYPLVDGLTPAFGMASASESNTATEVRRCVVELAVQRFRWATGRYPASLEEIAPYVTNKELLIDPVCGKPFQVGFVKEDGQAGEVFEVMHGDDERPASEKRPVPGATPATAPKPSGTPKK